MGIDTERDATNTKTNEFLGVGDLPSYFRLSKGEKGRANVKKIDDIKDLVTIFKFLTPFKTDVREIRKAAQDVDQIVKVEGHAYFVMVEREL